MREVTAERVKQHFGGIVKGVSNGLSYRPRRPNFLLHESLGMVTLSLMTMPRERLFSTGCYACLLKFLMRPAASLIQVEMPQTRLSIFHIISFHSRLTSKHLMVRKSRFRSVFQRPRREAQRTRRRRDAKENSSPTRLL